MESFNKTVRIGRIADGAVFCTIKFSGEERGRLSIVGVIGPTKGGNCRGACGQIDSTLAGINPTDWKFAKGWDYSKLHDFLRIWERWHLNDMRAGSPTQETFLRENPPVYAYPKSYYETACEVLAGAGILEDWKLIHDGKPYKYGTSWLYEEVPNEVLEFLGGLPTADSPMPAAWQR